MMTRTIKSALILGSMAALAFGDTLNFAGLPGPFNINTPSSSNVDMLSSPVTATFIYDPSIPAGTVVANCLFDAVNGTVYDFFGVGCVGAQVDTGGMNGTSDGFYDILFSQPLTIIGFNFGITSFALPAPDPGDYSLTASFYLGGTLSDPNPVTVLGVGGRLAYTGPAFDEMQLNFMPITGPDVGTPYGQTLVSITSVTDTPEPGAMLLLVSGLCGIIGSRWFKRARKRG